MNRQIEPWDLGSKILNILLGLFMFFGITLFGFVLWTIAHGEPNPCVQPQGATDVRCTGFYAYPRTVR